jgi:hypothetical protein
MAESDPAAVVEVVDDSRRDPAARTEHAAPVEQVAPAGQGDAPFDPESAIASLRRRAADQLDPLRFRYIEALAARAPLHQGELRRRLDVRLAAALASYTEYFEQMHDEAVQAIADVVEHHPESAAVLQRLLVAGDFKGIRRTVARLQSPQPHAPLAELTRHIAQQAKENGDGSAPGVGGDGGEGGPGPELKALRKFRNTWSKLSVDKQVTQAIEQAPENAGPINSHMLVLRSLALMRDISPDYLSRFMSYAETLLWLDQADPQVRPAAKGRARQKR